MEFKQEVFDRFNSIFKRKKSSKLKKSDLVKEQCNVYTLTVGACARLTVLLNAASLDAPIFNEDLLHELEIQKEMIQHLKNALAKAHDELESNRQKYYEEGIRHGRYLSELEEIGVLDELKILQDITATLQNDKDHNPDIEVK